MTQNKVVEMIAAIKTIYPYYAKETDAKILVKTWTALMADIPDDIADKAFYKALQVCKMPPTPADVLEEVEAIISIGQPTDMEYWCEYSCALSETATHRVCFGFTFVEDDGKTQGDRARERVHEVWEKLSEPVKQYLASENELIRKSREVAENMEWEQKAFIKAIPGCRKRIVYAALASGKPMLNA
jgi:hypothetical protein